MTPFEKSSKPFRHHKRLLPLSMGAGPPETSSLRMNNKDLNNPKRKFAEYSTQQPKGAMLMKPPNAGPDLTDTKSLTAPTVVLLQPQPAHHFSFVKGDKWFGGKFYNRNYLGKGIRRVEKDFLVV